MWILGLNGVRTVCCVGYHGNMLCKGTDFVGCMFTYVINLFNWLLL